MSSSTRGLAALLYRQQCLPTYRFACTPLQQTLRTSTPRRYQSTVPKKQEDVKTEQTEIQLSEPDPRYNPPAITRPWPLELPTQDDFQSKPQYWFACGKRYLSFYKTGLWAVWKARKEAKSITARVRKVKEEYDAATHQHTPPKAPWTRAEFQLVRRSKYDVRRFPVFLVLFAVCGEFTPLVLASKTVRDFLTPRLPATVRLPEQQKLMRDRATERRKQCEKKWGNVDQDKMSVEEYASYSVQYHGLGGKWAALLPGGMRTKYNLHKTRQHYEYLYYDDILLGVDGVNSLIDEEVVTACLDRGIWEEDKSIADLRKRLRKSVEESKKVTPLKMEKQPKSTTKLG